MESKKSVEIYNKECYKIDYIEISLDEYRTIDDKGKGKLKPATEICEILIKKTSLKYCKIYLTPDIRYLYLKDKGYYVVISYEDFKVLVGKVLRAMIKKYYSVPTMEKVVKELEYSDLSIPGMPEVDSEYIVFPNGIFNTKTLQFTHERTLSKFVINSVDFEYDQSDEQCPEFMEFIDCLCDGHEDRKKFIQGMFFFTITSLVKGSVFFFIYGPGGAGKSTATLALASLLGSSVKTTTLQSLNRDQFEIVTLIGKKLILVNDTIRT